MSTQFTKADIENCQRACYDCTQAEQEIARLEALGLDVAEVKARCQQLKEFHNKFIELYSPLIPQEGKSKGKK